MVGGVGGWFGCTSSHGRESCETDHMVAREKIFRFLKIVLYDFAV